MRKHRENGGERERNIKKLNQFKKIIKIYINVYQI